MNYLDITLKGKSLLLGSTREPYLCLGFWLLKNNLGLYVTPKSSSSGIKVCTDMVCPQQGRLFGIFGEGRGNKISLNRRFKEYSEVV